MNNIPWWRTLLGKEEAKAAKEAVIGGKISQGNITSELEKRLAERLEVPYVTMTTSGSVAILMALIVCGIRPGDEVIVPNRTFIATAHAPQLLGARVRLVDTLPDIPLIDPDEVEKTISPQTKAIIPVHLNGRACGISLLREIADRHGIYLIEDAAQALFSKYNGRPLGSFGHVGCFSLGVTKIITSGQGGFVATSNQAFHERLQVVRSHGVHSPSSEHFDSFGFNFRYTDIQAAITLKQLDRVPEKIGKHIQLYRRYQENIKKINSIRMVEVDIDNGEIPLWIEVLCEDCDRLAKYMAQRGIETRKATPNLNVSPHLFDARDFPNSKYFEQHLFILPSGPDQDPEDIQKTIDAINEFERR